MEMLQLNDLHKTFNPGTVNEKVTLNGVSLQMEAGDFATIVGSNGAGKSTLFNAITGGFIADEGSILLGGQDITFAPEHQRSKVIGHLFQDPLKGTAPNMTIEENLALAYLRAGTAPNAIFSRISRKDKALFREKLALLDMGLEDRMKQPVGLLSGGQRQALTLCDGKTPADLPYQTFDNGIVTINTETAEALGLDLAALKEAFKPYCTEITEVTTAENFS